MRPPWPAILIVAVLAGIGAPGPRAAEPVESITIFAAASTADAVQAIAKAYGAERHVAIICSFASSSTLAKQIEQGAPADLFLSADERWMDHLAEKRAIVVASRVDLLANGLVLVAPVGKPLAVTVEKGFPIGDAFDGRLAIADPASVPAGIYAREAFADLGWWDALSGRLAPALDVRAALRLVELGEAELGVVYATDARASAKVAVVAAIPERCHRPIRYPAALTTGARTAAAAFLAHLQGPAARAVFSQAGFAIPEASAPAKP